ncbi:MAG: Ig domain-containing protein, partial [Planctomycetota bacterium]
EEGYVNQPLSFTPRVEDPENGNLTYRVEHEGLENLTIDKETGRIEWTPEEVGEFEVLVYARDDGMPAKEATRNIRLVVTEPPPREDPPPSKPAFDEAKHAFVTGIVEMGDQRQVWVTIRTAGELLKLNEGDHFEVGSKAGRVLKVHARHVEILSEGTVYMVPFGKTVYEGKELGPADPEEGDEEGDEEGGPML